MTKQPEYQTTHVAIPVAAAQAIANYLGTKAYVEVAEFIAIFQQAPSVNLPPPQPEVPVEKSDSQKQLDAHVRQAVIDEAVAKQAEPGDENNGVSAHPTLS